MMMPSVFGVPPSGGLLPRRAAEDRVNAGLRTERSPFQATPLPRAWEPAGGGRREGYFLPAVTPGQSSVRKGQAGNPSLL